MTYWFKISIREGNLIWMINEKLLFASIENYVYEKIHEKAKKIPWTVFEIKFKK